MKCVSAPKAIKLRRKENTWIQRPLPGPHVISGCAPISYILKTIGVAQTMKEVKKILSSRSAYIDGKVVAEPKFPVGLMDMVTIGDKSWRITFSKKGVLIATPSKENKSKICRIEGKTRAQKGKIQFSLHDGKTIMSKDGKEGKVGDCLLISLPEAKILKKYPLETKMNCFISGGKHVGKKAVIEEIIPGTATRLAQVKCNIDGILSTTYKGYIFPIGDSKLE